MSLGPSSLGNLLAQRLDTVLGLGQSGTARTGAHPDALRQAQPANRLIPTEERLQRGQAGVGRADSDKAGQASERGRGATVSRQDPRLASQLQRFITDNRFTASAPTTLGRTARTILSLFSQHGNHPVQGRAPLLQPQQLAQALAQAKSAATPSTAQKNTDPALDRRNLPPISQSGQKTGATLRAALPTASNAASQSAAAPNTTALANLARVAGGSSALANVFMNALSQNVQQSGMFYESQLAQLVKGQISPEQLRQQPQAQAHLQPATQEEATTQNTKSGQQSLHAAQTASNLLQSGIDPSTQHIVRQQLEVLANQLFSWRGEAWPGVPMELEVQRRHEDTEDEWSDGLEQDEGNTPWQTRLRVELPQLGEVEARLYIDDKALRMHIRAPQSAQALNNDLQTLVQRLQAQNITIEQLQVASEENTND